MAHGANRVPLRSIETVSEANRNQGRGERQNLDRRMQIERDLRVAWVQFRRNMISLMHHEARRIEEERGIYQTDEGRIIGRNFVSAMIEMLNQDII